MKANELRIGNYLLLCNEIVNISAGFIADYDFSKRNKFNENTPIRENDVSPIPLTEEWILKFGFEKEFEHIFIFPNNMSIRIVGYAWNIQMFDLCCEWYDTPIRSIKYIHQLQNLYFALTGEELELKNQ